MEAGREGMNINSGQMGGSEARGTDCSREPAMSDQPCSMYLAELRDGNRYRCELKEGHDGWHVFRLSNGKFHGVVFDPEQKCKCGHSRKHHSEWDVEYCQQAPCACLCFVPAAGESSE